MKNNISMLDEAFNILEKKNANITFTDLVDEIAKNLEMSDDEKKAHLGVFYTDLSLDGRFVALTDNTWDLRSRHIYDKVHINVNDVYSDVESEESDDDDEEEKEYNAQVEGKTFDDAEPIPSDEEDPEKKETVDDDIAGLGIKKGEDY
jgi:DNA-directed RNA polymerase subunit delta